MGTAVFVIAILYVLVGQKLILDASRHLRNPHRRYFYTPLLSPEEFTDAGERFRRRAVRYLYGGGIVVALLFVLVWFLQRA